ncbi:MAG: TrkH family potassium uptake protein [Odoribacter sp.]
MGRLLLVESVFLSLCIVIALLYGESDTMAFLYATLITMGAGGCLILGVNIKDRVLAKKDGYFMVTMVWVVFSLFGALPFMLGGTIPSFVDAFFETMSGFTTTGSSILTNVEALPHATLFWRSLTQWLGGLGIIMLFIAILPSLGIEGRDLYVAEVTGPTHSKSSFTFAATARRMWVLYTVMTVLQTVLLMFGGMDLFDSVCHSFASMATGGFSTKQDSVGYWDSAYIQYVIVVFMFLAGSNFGLLYAAFARGAWQKLFKDREFQLYFMIAAVASVVIGGGLYFTGWGDAEKSFRDAIFQVVTLMTTTGFATADYLLWPPLLGMILLLLFFIGASAGSTSGGIKVVRVYLLFKNSFGELKRIIHPNAIINVKYNNKTVHPNVMTGIMGFGILFMIIFTISSLIMTLFTEDIMTACSAVITSMSNVGPAFGSLGPMDNFSQLDDFAKIFLAILMLVGRLEIFTVMVLFTKSFWRK